MGNPLLMALAAFVGFILVGFVVFAGIVYAWQRLFRGGAE